MRHDSGLAASPWALRILGVEGSGYFPFACPLWMDKPFANRRRARRHRRPGKISRGPTDAAGEA
jgi:hypothetical protein